MYIQTQFTDGFVRNSVTILCIVIIFGSSVWSQPLRATARKSCGPKLVERVRVICQTRGGHKSYTNSEQHERYRRGIVNECCKNKCPDQHIYAYCSNSKREVKSSETDGYQSNETPSQMHMEQSNGELEANALVHTIAHDSITIDTSTIVEDVTESTTFNQRYSNLYVNRDIDLNQKNKINKILSDLSNRQQSDFQVGTVPPEYRIMPMMPSRSRIMD